MRTRRLITASVTVVAMLSGCAVTGTPPTTAPSTIPATRSSAGGFQPRKDASSKTGYYIPRDLDDALVEADRIFVSAGEREAGGNNGSRPR